MNRWIEVEPGAPLPAEVPPWAERHELEMRPELSGTRRRLALAAGVVALGVSATMLLMGNTLGLAGVLPGLVFVYAGWTGGPKHPDYVPSPGGRYVLAEVPPEPRDIAELERARKRMRRVGIAYWGGAAVFMTAIVALGHLSPRDVGMVLAAVAAGGLPGAIEAVKRRLTSEAEVSDRFLEASDPRRPLTGGIGHTSAVFPRGGAAEPGESQEPLTE